MDREKPDESGFDPYRHARWGRAHNEETLPTQDCAAEG